jgi:succinate dehydrogenase / fumarate reductase, membrane anchor subunit
VSLRSPLGRVLGLGSAKDGTEHWWSQRITAVALVPLTAWFAIALLSLPALDYQTVHAWLSVPFTAVLAVLLVAVATYHSYLGVNVIVEDYTTHAKKVLLLVLLRFIHILAGAAGVFAILRVAFGFSRL